MAEETKTAAPRSWLELVAECEGKQAAILLQWAARIDVDAGTLTAWLDPSKPETTSEDAARALRSLGVVASELRDAGAGLNHTTAQRVRDAEATKSAAGFAPQGMLRTRAPKT